MPDLSDRQIHELRKLIREALEPYEHALHKIHHRLERIERELRPHRTASVANVFTGELSMADNALVLNVGQSSIDTLTPRLADGTPSGGVVSNVGVKFSDLSATATVQTDGTILFAGVAPSANGPVSGVSSCTVTDTDGAVSTWSIPFTVQVNAVPPPPTQLTQSVANVFSTPTP